MKVYLTVFFCLFFAVLYAQTPLSYYLPEGTSYDSSIPQPAQILGHEVGELHVTHDKLVFYLTHLARVSDRISVDTIGYTHEKRPLIHLKITSPENHQNLESLRKAHLNFETADEKSPVVIWEGFSIHGNESSGSNAALVTAYHLAAAQGEEIEKILREAIIILDPCFNPDGLTRFATWVNANKGSTQNADPNTRELNEPWPSGRTNHYWFDLNRDWLLVQHPESQARIREFHRWRPNILTDHHEMGTNSTFFFQPGVPSRTNPLTPNKNQVLTGEIAKFHAKALDKIGSLYFTEESFDDFYYGKGSTYPDANGSIGILFEQASSRGHAQASQHGVLTFPFTIRNQFVTTLSTIEAGINLRRELLDYQKAFYQNAQSEAKADTQKAFVVGHPQDSVRRYHFEYLLHQHQIQTYRLSSKIKKNGETFTPENSILIPLEQPQYKLIRAIFQQETEFSDSLFYDVSAWTMPLAFGLRYADLGRGELSRVKGERIETPNKPTSTFVPDAEAYAYLLDWYSYDAPMALADLHAKNVLVKVSQLEFSHEGKTFPAGTLIIPTTQPDHGKSSIEKVLANIAQKRSVVIRSLKTGLTDGGIDLGSRNMFRLGKPKVLLITGKGVRAYDAGEVWHLLDKRVETPVTLGTAADLGRLSLSDYSVIVMANGQYSLTEGQERALSSWVFRGGTLITLQNATRWAVQNQFLRTTELVPQAKSDTVQYRPYGSKDRDEGAQYVGGMIVEAEIDSTHPLCFGYSAEKIPLFKRGTFGIQDTKMPYIAPIRYTEKLRLSGYISSQNLDRLKGLPAAIVETRGRGRIIGLVDNLNFRAFWYGTNRIFLNAVFFGKIME